ncbi:MAG: hypothetical protein R6W78_06405, partial [Bacteroidales bacterium]
MMLTNNEDFFHFSFISGIPGQKTGCAINNDKDRCVYGVVLQNLNQCYTRNIIKFQVPPYSRGNSELDWMLVR